MEILEHRINYNGKTYTVSEPTLDVYMALQKEIDYASDMELAVSLIGWVTGLDDSEIKEADAYSIMSVAEHLIEYYNESGKKFYETFEFLGKTYKFLDMKGMTFGEYIDIDTFLQKPNSYKQTRLNELMAMLYREVDENGKQKPYNVEEIKANGDLFRKLPLKYFNGCLVFFYHIGNMSLKPTRLFLLRQMITRTYWKMSQIIKTRLGGMVRLLPWRGRTSSR